MSTDFLKTLEANTKQPAKPESSLSAASRLRLRLPDIELALSSGFTHRQILQQLNREGIELTPAYYHRLIPKLRSEAKAARTTLIASGAKGLVHSAGVGAEPGLGQPAAPPLQEQASTTGQTYSNNANLSSVINRPAVVPPRTIARVKPDGPKFNWDPRGAEKIDPNNI